MHDDEYFDIRFDPEDESEFGSLKFSKQSRNKNYAPKKINNFKPLTNHEKIDILEDQLKYLRENTPKTLGHNPYQKQIAKLEAMLRELKAKEGLILTSDSRNQNIRKFDSKLQKNKKYNLFEREIDGKNENSKDGKDDIKKIDIPENSIELEESKKLAELIAIGLGDGQIPEDLYSFKITLDGKEQVNYIQYTKTLMEELLKKTPKIHPRKDSNATYLVVYGKDVVGGLVKKGLVPGDKVRNQVGIPGWVNKWKNYQIGSLRGLTDTDGSIFVKKAQKSIRIGFQNHSKPLVEGFKELCKRFDIKTGKVTEYLRVKKDKKFKQYDLLVAGKFEVSKFIDIIKPKKWEYRAELLGLTLVSLEDPQKRKNIERELIKVYPDERTHYTEDYKNLLKNLCEQQGYNVNKASIIHAIEDSLTNKHLNQINQHGKKIIDDLKQKWIGKN